MNQKLTDLALQVGGSHYPSVAKEYLPTTVKLVTEALATECQRIIDSEEYTESQKHAVIACKTAIVEYYK